MQKRESNNQSSLPPSCDEYKLTRSGYSVQLRAEKMTILEIGAQRTGLIRFIKITVATIRER
jgi:hypothetical protein